MSWEQDAAHLWQSAPRPVPCFQLDLPPAEGNPASLLEQALRFLRSLPDPSSSRTVSLRIPLKKQTIGDWLSSLEELPGMLWTDRTHRLWSLGLGWVEGWRGEESDDLSSLFSRLRQLPSRWPACTRVFGGLSFGSSLRSGSPWRTCGRARLGLPMVTLSQETEQASLWLRWKGGTEETGLSALIELLREAARALRNPAEASWPTPAASPLHTPTRKAWAEGIQTARAAFRASSLQKVVLARQTRWRLSRALPLSRVLGRFVERAPDTFVFFFRWEEGGEVFFGATPERLYKRSGKNVFSEALAGTRPRGETHSEDEALGAELLQSEKDLYEQGLVMEELVALFQEICDDVVRAPEPSVRKLQTVQHLCTTLRGCLRKHANEEQLLERFHPTPAVGGRPRKKALETLGQLESFERGWYAAPVGWWSQEASEWGVAIRSALLVGRELYAFSGAGIVPDSREDLEWAELNHKLLPISSLLAFSEEGFQ